MVKFTQGRIPPAILSDADIDSLVKERKVLPWGWTPNLTAREDRRSLDLIVPRADGSKFRLFVRSSISDPAANFSAGLVFIDTSRYIDLVLRRYNGPSHPHTNRLEGEPEFWDFHIHLATERYQASRHYKNEHYAVVTRRFGNVEGALRCLLDDCGFVPHPHEPASLFDP